MPRTPLLHGTYRPPALKRGDRAHCHVRDCEMRVTGWSGGHIPWPKGCERKQSPGSPGIIVDEELARAVRHESATAVMYWWGVSNVTVIKWRRALGVTRKNNEGTHALVCAAMKKAKAAQNPVRSDEYRETQRQHTLRRRPWEKNPPPPPENPWRPEELALLGTGTDLEVARKVDRSRVAVKSKRRKLGIAPRARGDRA